MKLVNETNVAVTYWITASGMGDCGEIAVNDSVDYPGYDNLENVTVEFLPAGGGDFTTTWATTKTGEQTELTLVAV